MRTKYAKASTETTKPVQAAESVQTEESSVKTETAEVVETTVVVSEEAPTATENAVEICAEAPAEDAEVISQPNILGKAVYGLCYSVSYGAVYSGLLIAKVFPKKGLIASGLHDGAVAAREVFEVNEAEAAVEPEVEQNESVGEESLLSA